MRFRNGYNKEHDLTEDEYLERLLDLGDWEEGDDEVLPLVTDDLEGEPFEDTYFPGVPDYDLFGRPSWGTEE